MIVDKKKIFFYYRTFFFLRKNVTFQYFNRKLTTSFKLYISISLYECYLFVSKFLKNSLFGQVK